MNENKDDYNLISRLFAELPRRSGMAEFGQKERVWQRVQNHIRAVRAQGVRERAMGFWAYFMLPRTLVRVGVTVLVIALALSMVGGVAYAQPGETLYSVKIAAEQVELVLATNDEAKVTVGIKHAKRRLQEVQTLVETNQDTKVVQDTLNALKSATEGVVNVATTAAPDSDLVTKASEFAAEQEAVLSTVSNTTARSEVKDAVESAISAAKESLTKLSGEDVKGVATTETQASPAVTPSTTPTVLSSPIVSSPKPPKKDSTLDAGILIDEVITIGDDNQATPVGQ